MDKTLKEKYQELEKRAVALEGSVQVQLQYALNNLDKLERKAALAKTEKEKQILLNEIELLEATISRAKGLLCL